MKVHIITYNVNQGPRGGVSVGELAPTRFPEIFLFLFFCSDVSGFVQVSCIFLYFLMEKCHVTN